MGSNQADASSGRSTDPSTSHALASSGRLTNMPPSGLKPMLALLIPTTALASGAPSGPSTSISAERASAWSGGSTAIAG